jgi:acyl-CoA thioesterase
VPHECSLSTPAVRNLRSWSCGFTAPVAGDVRPVVECGAVDARAWLGLQPTHNPMRWYLPVTPGICTGHRFLFGGCALGAAISALEGSTGRPIIWATAQYLNYAHPPEVVDIDITIASQGRNTTQARAVAHVADTEILTVNAALGHRDLDASGQWPDMPEVDPPEVLPPREVHWDVEDSILSRLDQRIARQDAEHGRTALWSRMPDVLEVSAPALAVIGDYVPMGIAQALATDSMSSSLDNTLRVGTIVPTEWVLIDIRIDLVSRGFGHGIVYLWSMDGTLMATASQSAIIRRRPD